MRSGHGERDRGRKSTKREAPSHWMAVVVAKDTGSQLTLVTMIPSCSRELVSRQPAGSFSKGPFGVYIPLSPSYSPRLLHSNSRMELMSMRGARGVRREGIGANRSWNDLGVGAVGSKQGLERNRDDRKRRLDQGPSWWGSGARAPQTSVSSSSRRLL